jgi:hypothetical protein
VQVLTWNAAGRGKLASKLVTTSAAGAVSVSVPPGGVVAATTRMGKPT